MDAARMNWRKQVELYEAGGDGLQPPWAVTQPMQATPAEWGISNDSYNWPFRVWYVTGTRNDDGTAKTSNELLTEVEQAIVDLSRAIRASTSLTVYDQIRDVSDTNDANKYFLANNAPFYAGYVQSVLVVGDTL